MPRVVAGNADIIELLTAHVATLEDVDNVRHTHYTVTMFVYFMHSGSGYS